MSRPTVAVVGASRQRGKFGNKCVRAFLQKGYLVYPVNLREKEIENLSAYRSLGDLPETPDKISIYLPPQKTRALLPQLAQHRTAEVWFNPGSADEQILAAARDAGVNVRSGCSIVDIGLSPAQFP